MITTFQHKNKKYTVDLNQPLDISIPVKATEESVNAWYILPPEIKPVRDQDWVAKVSEGAAVNFNNIHFNPHSHGTHTESLGHITPTFYDINQTLTTYHFIAQLITISPVKDQEDFIITEEILTQHIKEIPDALIIRTLPNPIQKKSKNHSHTNWPYLTQAAARWICKQNIKHLLIDLPSVDKEKDDGKLEAHKAFWGFPDQLRKQATITELIYVEDTIPDGIYLLNLQVAPIQNDAAPSRPLLYKILDTL
ncbi:cyclase family protein [Aquimarina sp. ERC-38]|uniref:cyclase family protein n=1 Tax=Aquimarina sp. ERC-38 TaxID=2949996 RepID=UPI0022478B39|nr:cyclase family protein [Aquimarina sp. ERC-38]UZO81560.1 cyclase family protein [Aquimarina sp. ERC-38]